ncbi:MAG: ATP-binding protein, partial [Acidobacteriota bacterium]
MRELRQQLTHALLAVMTVAAFVAAVINFQQQAKFRLPVDGATWVDQHDGPPVARNVAPRSPAENAGIHPGDTLISISGVRVNSSTQATQLLTSIGPWRKTDYRILHEGVEVPANVLVGEAPHNATLYYQYAVGVVYLAIGLYVYFRRRGAPRALHFFLLCLTSFILSSFHYTGKLNNFDKAIYLGNVVAGFLAPALFLHLACSYPDQQAWIRRKRAALLLYIPGLAILCLHLGFNFGWLRASAPLIEVLWTLDRVWLGYLCAYYLTGAMVFGFRRRTATDPIVRSQLSWLRNGALAGILPFTLLYAVPYLLGVAPNQFMNLAVLALPLIPLTWSYAIFRYRLMDVEIIFEQGAIYSLATLAVLGVFYGLIFSVSGAGEVNGLGMLAMVLIAAFVFQPIRNWIREQLNRYVFYKDRYDYRRTLIEFARELGSPGDLHAMLETVADRLIRTLGIRHVAFFVRDENPEGNLDGSPHPCKDRFFLELASNRAGDQTDEVPGLDLSFLTGSPTKPYLFFERTRHMIDVQSHELPAGARRSIADLELTYYLPCAARGRTIAYLGVSRTETGDFLSTEDIQLLQTLTGYVGIAIDNSRLYASLQRKVDQYERLKEFSENIVESIHVGILAADPEDRVESWNSQMEKLTGVSRQDAVGRSLSSLLPLDLCDSLEPSRGGAGIQNLYQYLFKAREATLNIATAPLYSKDGSRIGRLIIFDDVTDRAELERRLVQADKLSSIGLLAAGVAHEVNTPLAVISTYAQMLAKQISGDEQKAPLLEKIARQTFRASEIVNSLLNFSRVAATDFVSVDLNKVIRETISLLQHQLDNAQVKVDLALEESGAGSQIKGSQGKLQQVVLNLVMNARDAMERGGTLSILTSCHDGQVRVTVADTGSGIPAHVLPRIFDPFFTTKVDATFTEQGGRRGTGLGLSVSYGIVREHGGTIEVESTPGRGTRFLLSFPQYDPAAVKSTVREALRSTYPAPTSAPATAVAARNDLSPSVPAAITAQSDRLIH